MILQALADYYELLRKEELVPAPGYSAARVSYAIVLSESGEPTDIVPLRETVTFNNKPKEVPKSMQVPEQVLRTAGVSANFLCDNAAYFAGIDAKGKPERAKKCFEDAKQLHKTLLEGVDCKEARAVLAYFKTWKPENAAEELAVFDLPDDFLSANLVFFVNGCGFAHEAEPIRAAWQRHLEGGEKAPELPCLISGEIRPAARLHKSIKGVRGAQTTGAAIVSFNASAYESYGKDGQQGLNAPVSEASMFAYTTALNYLLSDAAHRLSFGDSTVLFWAQSSEPLYRNLFSLLLDPSSKSEQPEDADTEPARDAAAERRLREVFKKLANGKPLGDMADVFDANTKFYVLALSPNAARISVRFFLRDTFGGFVEKLRDHYRNMEIERAPFEPEFVPLWRAMLETVSSKSKDKAASPLLAGAVLRSILTGAPYPDMLLSNVLLRIRTEHEINRAKAGLIKACLIKKQTNQTHKEVLTVSLNEKNTNKAYVLGRLFSVLEKAQLDASPNINATIKDRYFASACATPALVFPTLLRLSAHHTAKAEYGYASENRIRDILNKLKVDDTPLPAQLSLEEQGLFILGYYHQNKANYAKVSRRKSKHVGSDQKQVRIRNAL